MKFCIGNKEYFEGIGFNTRYWRTSTDGIDVLTHYLSAKMLIPDIDTNINVTIYEVNSEELRVLMEESVEWGNTHGN